MPADTIIEVDRISKQYRLGEVSTGTIVHDVNRWWHRVRGKEDPYLKVTRTNAGSRHPGGDASMAASGDPEYVWALNDVSFEVKRGEVLGIIGRNGAGKSTLLKIMSRVTAPTSGEIRIDGRIAALLEVGTGFHPELTGRENIYLNGAILGMTKAEISARLEEVVEFSGCARYLDTPTKRYSSGMVVRLGFAVAAHLEPEILIVDEVLAVGDAEFQKKCIGKMQDVAGHGRTVLFVSHNLDSIQALTSRCIVLSAGRIKTDAPTEEAIHSYILPGDTDTMIGPPKPIASVYCEKRSVIDPLVAFASLGLGTGGTAEISSGGDLILEIGVASHGRLDRMTFGYTVRHESLLPVLSGYTEPVSIEGEGVHVFRVVLRQLELAPGSYDLCLSINQGSLTESRHGYEVLFGVAGFKVTSSRKEGGVLPPWRSGWGHVIHRQAEVRRV